MSLPNIHRIHDSAICKECLTVLDAATCAQGDHKPKEGDFTICIKCGALSRFTADMLLDLCTEYDMEVLKDDNPEGYEHLLHVQQIIRSKRHD